MVAVNRKISEALDALKEAGLLKYGMDENGDINLIYADSSGTQKFKGELDFAADIEVRDAGYNIANKDDDGTPNYYGFEDSTGAWYIMRETVSAGNDIYEYIKGDSDYSTSWTGRAGLSYVSYSSAF